MDRRRFLVTLSGAAAALAGTALGCSARSRGSAPAVSARLRPLDAAAFHAERRFAPTASGRIAYVERGDAALPAALFVHGLPLNGFQWRGALERLAGVRRCLAPDSLGLGYSEVAHPGKSTSPEGVESVAPEAQATMLVAFLDRLGIDTADLVASDSGGAVAQLLVARHPERFRSLLLTNCDSPEDSPPEALLPVIAAARAGTFADDVLSPQLADPASSRLASGLAGCCYTYPLAFAPETLAVYLAPLLASEERKAQLHAYCVALAQNPLREVVPQLRSSNIPVRLVWGTGDAIFSPATPELFARTFPNWRGARLVAGANLFFPEEMPDLIAYEARALWRAG